MLHALEAHIRRTADLPYSPFERSRDHRPPRKISLPLSTSPSRLPHDLELTSMLPKHPPANFERRGQLHEARPTAVTWLLIRFLIPSRTGHQIGAS